MKTDRLYQLTSHLLMAACATLFAGSLSSCSNEDPTDKMPVSGKWQISIPATIDINADTRAVKYEEGKLKAEFRTSDNIYVIKNGSLDSNALHPDQDGTTANLVGKLNGTYAANDELTLLYNTKDDGTFSFAEQIGGHMENGELDSFDYAIAKVKVISATDGNIETKPATFQSLQSMYKFTFVDSAGNPVKVTKLLVSTANNDLITSGSFLSTPNKTNGSVITDVASGVDAIPCDEVWVALSKASNSADTFIFDVLDIDNNAYMGTLDVKSEVIQNGKFYTATITLTKQSDPLTLEAIEAGTITIKNPLGLVISYMKNMETRVTSTKDNTNDITISVAANDVVRFYGNNESYCTVLPDIKNTNIQCSSSCYIYGNIMSLINAKDYDTAKTLTGSFTFMTLFEDNTNIKSHDSKPLTLPATTLTEGCYSQMFRYSGLTTAPALPATTLAEGCYEYMFANCTALTTAPALPATTLAVACYQFMFYGCSGLTTAPALPATTLTESCYSHMFENCKSLTTAPALPATTLAVSCYEYMFYGCSGLTTAPALPATTLAVSCYENMFAYCTALTTAPALPATELKDRCYFEMFYGCSGLYSITCLATDISADLCTDEWLVNVSREGTFYKAAIMKEGQSWSRGSSGIPSGWTVEEYEE
ncbi:MAG: hypothetical protein E7100_00505 [Bacteroidaceae bacterium]|jgi:hypothetical protein|nr:hypothetical protein [Bacteroidaceae bacterium]